MAPLGQHPPSLHAISPVEQHILSVVQGPPVLQHPPLLQVARHAAARASRARWGACGVEDRVVLKEKISKTCSARKLPATRDANKATTTSEKCPI